MTFIILPNLYFVCSLRCVEIIAHTTTVSLASAENALLRAIHKVDVVIEELISKPRSFHIAASILPAHMRHCAQTILPLSMLLATGKWLVADALDALQKEPRVSVLLDQTVLKVTSPCSNNPSKFAVLFDLGGTNIRVATACTNSSNSKIEMNPIYSSAIGEDKSEEAVLRLLREVYEQVLVQDGFPKADAPCCVVMAQPGRLNDCDGSISGLANFPWSRPFPMKAVLNDISGCEQIKILDDCDAALYGEIKSSAMASTVNENVVVMLTIGTGIGSALFCNSAPYKGARRLIEGGHMIIHPGGLQCPCGQRGCLEMYCSGTAIGLSGQSQSQHIRGTSGGVITAEDVVREAQHGNKIATNIITTAAKDLAIGLVNVCRMYDPHMVIIGGGLGGILFDLAKTEFCNQSWNIHDDDRDIKFVLANCDESGLAGCLSLSMEYFEL